MQINQTTTLMGVILEEDIELTIHDICSACRVEPDFIIALVEEGVLIPAGDEPPQWHFSGTQLSRVKKAVNLQRDFDVNIAGVALALQLFDEIKQLRAELNLYRHRKR
jgi:chaperone modulatory protein CbpM